MRNKIRSRLDTSKEIIIKFATFGGFLFGMDVVVTGLVTITAGFNSWVSSEPCDLRPNEAPTQVCTTSAEVAVSLRYDHPYTLCSTPNDLYCLRATSNSQARQTFAEEHDMCQVFEATSEEFKYASYDTDATAPCRSSSQQRQ